MCIKAMESAAFVVPRQAALRQFVGLDAIHSFYTGYSFVLDKIEYLVLSDLDARYFAAVSIESSPKSVGYEFIAEMTGRSVAEVSVSAISELINETCGFDEFINSAIETFGVAYFLGAELVGRSGRFTIYRRPWRRPW